MARFRRTGGILLFVAIVFSTPALAGVGSAFDHPQHPLLPGCVTHPPIVITQDEGPAGFVIRELTTGLAVYRPGSGVVAGTGTPEDPYRIRGWCIDRDDGPEDWPTVGVHIEETEAHVVVHDVVVSSFEEESGIQVLHAANVVVEHNVLRGNKVGVALIGDLVEPRGPIILRANKVIENDGRGVHVAASDVSIVGNEIARNGGGVFFDSDAANNHLQGNRVEDNRFIENGYGFGDYAHHHTPIVHNAFIDNRYGLAIHGEAEVRHNLIEGNEVGALAMGGGVFQHNNLEPGQRFSVALNGVALQENWWGHDSGPGGGLPDACTGATADGEGVPIDRFAVEPVCFDPWHTAPVPHAGPRP